MSEQNLQQNAQTEEAKTEAQTSNRVPADTALDYVLQTLVDLANETDIELGVTLTVAGFIVSGTLISGKTFFDGVADEMSGSFQEPHVKKSIHTYFSNFGLIYAENKEDENRILPAFIHLRDAKLFHNSGKPIPGNRGVYWRGRIAQVSGFSMGTLSVE